jgi:hypothetical protein
MTKSLDNGGSLAVDRSSAGGRTLPLEGIVPPIRCCAGGSAGLRANTFLQDIARARKLVAEGLARHGIDRPGERAGMSPPDNRDLEILIAAATTAWRPHAPTGETRAHAAWADRDAAGRVAVDEATAILRRPQAARTRAASRPRPDGCWRGSAARGARAPRAVRRRCGPAGTGKAYPVKARVVDARAGEHREIAADLPRYDACYLRTREVRLRPSASADSRRGRRARSRVQPGRARARLSLRRLRDPGGGADRAGSSGIREPAGGAPRRTEQCLPGVSSRIRVRGQIAGRLAGDLHVRLAIRRVAAAASARHGVRA